LHWGKLCLPVGCWLARALNKGLGSPPVPKLLPPQSPVIVCPDVDVGRAVADAHFALFFNHGQCCAAGSRVYVHEAVYDEVGPWLGGGWIVARRDPSFDHSTLMSAHASPFLKPTQFVEKAGQAAVDRRVGDPFGDVDQGLQVMSRWLGVGVYRGCGGRMVNAWMGTAAVSQLQTK
jgi:hypothetical protein